MQNSNLFHMHAKTAAASIAIALVAWLSLMASPAYADEGTAIDISGGILQEGGLNQPAEGAGTGVGLLQAQADLDMDGIFKTFEYALDNWNYADASVNVDIAEFDVPLENVMRVYRAFFNTHPQYFYANANEVSYITSTEGDLLISVGMNRNYGKSEIEAFENKGARIASAVDPAWSDEQKVLYLHDYLISHCQYDSTLTKHSAYNALVDGSAVCEGYALAYKYLLGLVGIDCDIVTSVENNHAWNLVTVDSVQYYVDCTEDDPANIHWPSYVDHENLLRSKGGIETPADASGNHKANDQDWLDTAGRLVYQEDVAADSTKYDSYYWSECNTVIPHVGDLWAFTTADYHICAHDYASGNNVELATVDRWPVMRESAFWNANNASLASTGEAFAYTDPSRVWLLATDGTRTGQRDLTSDEMSKGYIYSLLYNEETGEFDCWYGERYDSVPAGSFSLDLATHVNSLAVSASALKGEQGETLQFSATIEPANALNKGIYWSSSDESVADVDANGSVILKKPGTATITATSADNASAFDQKTVTVDAASLEEGDVTLMGASGLVYDGSAHKPQVKVVHNGRTLVEITEYALDYQDNTDAGTATVTVTGTGYLEGTVTKRFSIAKATIAKPQVAENLVYDGVQHTAVPEAAGYSVESGWAENAGDYTATVTLDSEKNYAWDDGTSSALSIPWSIAPKPVAVTAGNASKVFGTSDPAFSANVKDLVKEDDEISFDITRDPGENAGTYSIVPSGKARQGNYAVTYEKATFTIEPANLSGASATLAYTSVEADGSAKKPLAKVSLNGKELADGQDYEMSYDSDAASIGNHTATITGKGNYVGSIELAYTITQGQQGNEGSGSGQSESTGNGGNQGQGTDDAASAGEGSADAESNTGANGQQSGDASSSANGQAGNAGTETGNGQTSSTSTGNNNGNQTNASGQNNAGSEQDSSARQDNTSDADTASGSPAETATEEQAGVADAATQLAVGAKVSAGSGASAATYTIITQSTVAYTKTKAASGSATVPATVTINGKSYKVTEIAAKAFKGKKAITSVTIGKNVKTIGKSAFQSCAKLAKVKGGANVVTIGNSAFQGCKKLKAFTFNKKVKTIGKKAFYKCTALKKLTFKGKKLKKVGSSAFKKTAKKATVKSPKAKKKAYKKLLKEAGLSKKAKYK